jgi:nitrate/TMAO reductase-like tetraheme cytochrome c subunit
VTSDKRLPAWSAAAAFGSVAIVVLTGLQPTRFSQWLVVELLACACLLAAYISERSALRTALCSAAALALAIPGMSIALRIGAGGQSLMCMAGSLGVPFALAALFYRQQKTAAVWAVVSINIIGALVLLWAGRLASVATVGVALLILVPFLAAGWLKCRVWSYAASVALFFAGGILLIAGNELGTGWHFMSMAALVCGMMLLVQSDPADKLSQSAVAAVGHAVAALLVLLLCRRNADVMQWQTILPLLITGGAYLYGPAQVPGQRSVGWMFLSLTLLPAAARLFGSDTGTFLILPAVLVPAWAIAGFKARETKQADCCRTSALLGLLICLIGAVRGPDHASILFILCLAGFLLCLLARRERFYIHLVLLSLALMGYGWIQQFGSHFTQELYFYLLLILGLATVVELSPYLAGYLDSIAPIPFIRLLTWRGIGLSAVVGILVAMTSATGFSLAVTEHPVFCTACHNMDKFYASWEHSSHQEVACIECHYEPGFTAHLQGKIGAISQVASFLTHRYDMKPHAEVSNQSCQRAGCHSDIDQDTDAFFKDKVHFSHQLHHDAMVAGRDLPCTVCHSQEAEAQHMGLASSTCFLCHFYGEGPAVQKTSDCISCHDAPQGRIDMGTSSFNHDAFFHGRKVDCHVCHLSTTQGDAHPHSVRCHSCHYGEQMDKLTEVSVEDVHEKHIQDEKMGCFECHGILKHGAPVKVAMTDAQQCANCHETDMQHALQAGMYMGTAVPDLPGEPNVMLEAGISCRHCHVEKTKLNRGGREFFTHVSPAEYCATCHGDEDYVDTFTMWQEDTKDALDNTSRAMEKAAARLGRLQATLPAAEREALEKRLKRAAELRQVVIDDGSMGIHSAFYAEEILDAAKSEIKAVEKSLEQMQ